MKLFLCEYELRPGTDPESLTQRARDLHELGTSRQDLIETWYTYPGERAGFMLLHAEDVEQLRRVLESYEDILSYKVKPVLEEVNYEVRVGVGKPRQELMAVS